MSWLTGILAAIARVFMELLWEKANEPDTMEDSAGGGDDVRAAFWKRVSEQDADRVRQGR